VIPVNSLNAGTEIRSPLAFCKRKLLLQLRQRLPVKNQLAETRTRFFSLKRICKSFSARLASTVSFASTSFTDGTARLAEANAASICSLALASSGSRAISDPALFTSSPCASSLSARPVLPERRGKFRSARAFPGWRANPRARFPAAGDFLLESFDFVGNFLAHFLKQFSRNQHQRFGRNRSYASRSVKFFYGSWISFSVHPVRATISSYPSRAARAPSSPPGFPRRSAARSFQETPRVPYRAASAPRQRIQHGASANLTTAKTAAR